MNGNPYDPHTHHPSPMLERSHLGPNNSTSARVQKQLTHGRTFKLIGAHGMGKSVFLHQIASELNDLEHVRVVLITGPQGGVTYKELLATLASKLELKAPSSGGVAVLLESWFALHESRHLILLYDEIGQYMREENPPIRLFLDNLEAVRRDVPGRLGILVAGGVGVLQLKHQWGSPFSEGAETLTLLPFDNSQIGKLAGAFGENRSDAKPLDDETIHVIWLHTGGNPRLVAHALRELWDYSGEISPAVVTEIFANFRLSHRESTLIFYRNIGITPNQKNAINDIWRHITEHDSPHDTATLHAFIDQSERELEDIIELLSASGVIRLQKRFLPEMDYLYATSVPSIRQPKPNREPRRPAATQREQLWMDIAEVSERIYRWGADFFRPKQKNDDSSESMLVPESVFSAVLAIHLSAVGWERVTREEQRGPGRTDLTLSHPSFEHAPPAIIEVKLWGHGNYKASHAQVLGYRTEGNADEQAMAVVMIGHRVDTRKWVADYRRECFGDGDGYQIDDSETNEVIPYLLTTRMGNPNDETPVMHFLLNLPRRIKTARRR